MDKLISYQSNLLKQVNASWFRYLYPVMDSNERMLGIKGLRGVGKTTLLLQYLHSYVGKGLYVTADHPYFYTNSLFDIATNWTNYGGDLLLIDEVHKYESWSRELKLIYDGFPGLKVVFTSSSALDLYRGESDLSRRVTTYILHGLSFREYLSLRYNFHFPVVSLESIFSNHIELTMKITQEIKALPLFNEYLQYGYFPIIKELSEESIPPRLLRIINTVLESDLAFVEGYSASNIIKLRKLLGVIAESAPFEPNISKIAERLQLGRNTVVEYLKRLNDAFVLHLLSKPGKGSSQLQKPGKIYFENSAFVYAMQENPQIGMLRETFLINQLKNSAHKVELNAENADFLIDGSYTIEVGGKNKGNRQIRNIDNSYKALDNIEYGYSNTVPLWLFGFLY